MKVKEDIVYDKLTGSINGFCNLGAINDELIQFECKTDPHPPIAKQSLVVMIHGQFFKFDFPLAHFSTEGVSADLLYPIGCIHSLDWNSGLDWNTGLIIM